MLEIDKKIEEISAQYDNEIAKLKAEMERLQSEIHELGNERDTKIKTYIISLAQEAA